LVSLALAGCGLAKSASAPVGTTADLFVRNTIIRSIKSMQKLHKPKCSSNKITDAKILGHENASIVEEWHVLSCGAVDTYKVVLTPTFDGGTTIKIEKQE